MNIPNDNFKMENIYCLTLSLDESGHANAISPIITPKMSGNDEAEGMKFPSTDADPVPNNMTSAPQHEETVAEHTGLASELNIASAKIDNLVDGLKLQNDEPAGPSRPDPVLSRLIDELLDWEEELTCRSPSQNQKTTVCLPDTPPASNESVDVNGDHKDIIALALKDLDISFSDSPEPEDNVDLEGQGSPSRTTETILVNNTVALGALDSRETSNSTHIDGQMPLPESSHLVSDKTNESPQIKDSVGDLNPITDQQQPLPAIKVPRKRGRPSKPQSAKSRKVPKAAVSMQNDNSSQITDAGVQSPYSSVVNCVNQPQNITTDAPNQGQLINQSFTTRDNAIAQSFEGNNLQNSAYYPPVHYQNYQPHNIATEAPQQRHIINQSFIPGNNLQHPAYHPPVQYQNNMNDQSQYSNAQHQFPQYPTHDINGISHPQQYPQISNGLTQPTQFLNMSNGNQSNLVSQVPYPYSPSNVSRPLSASTPHPYAMQPQFVGAANGVYQQHGSHYYSAGMQGYPHPPTNLNTSIPNHIHQQTMYSQNQNFQLQPNSYQSYSHNGSPHDYTSSTQFTYNRPPTPVTSPHLISNAYPPRCHSVPPQTVQSPLQDPVVKPKRVRKRKVPALKPIQQQQTNVQQSFNAAMMTTNNDAAPQQRCLSVPPQNLESPLQNPVTKPKRGRKRKAQTVEPIQQQQTNMQQSYEEGVMPANNNEPQQRCFSVPPQNLESPLQDPVTKPKRGRKRKVQAVNPTQQDQPKQMNMQQSYMQQAYMNQSYNDGMIPVNNNVPCNQSNEYPVIQQPPPNYYSGYNSYNMWNSAYGPQM